MEKKVLDSGRDPMGQAIRDYYETGRAGRLRVFSPQFEEDEMPVAMLFRTEAEMPPLERKALELCRGRVLDVGAGAGCHSLALQERGMEVTAIDISKLSVDVMLRRGVKEARVADLFDESFAGCYDTVLMLMNGSGIIGKLANIGDFFLRMKQLLNAGGCILMDSSDLKYLFEEEDGSFLLNLDGDYYGEVDFRMQYKQIKGEAFDWLYIDFDTLSLYASQYGFKTELMERDDHYAFLAKLTLRD